MHPSFYKRPFLIVFIIYVLALALFLKVPQPKQNDISFKAPASAVLSVYINSYPRFKENKQLFTADVLTFNGLKQKGRIYLSCTDCPELQRGQIITFESSLYLPSKQKNYGSFDWDKYLARKHIFTQGTITKIIEIKNPGNFWFYLSKVRTSILKVFKENLPSNSAAVLSGITLGEKGDIPDTLYTAFQDSGAMHLLVASGGNVGFITLIVYFLSAMFFGGRLRTAFIALTAALFYTLIAGADAPLLRAYLMTAAATFGFILGRKSGLMQGLLIAAFLILIVNPQSLFEAGFQMSFLATCAIILFTLNYKFGAKMPRLIKEALELFFVSFCAQLALFPVFTNYFYKISFSAVFSNLLLVPLSAVLMGGGFLLWLTSFCGNFIFAPVLFVMKILLFCFEYLVDFFAVLPVSHIIAPAMKITSIIAFYLLLFYLLNLPLLKKKLKSTLFVLPLAVMILICGIFVKGKDFVILRGNYNLNVVVKENRKIKMFGASLKPQIAEKALLAMGVKEIDCLFINSLSKSYLYMLKDFKLKIKNIYLPYGEIPEDYKPLFLGGKSEITQIFAGRNYCGVSVNEGWVFIDGKTEPSTNNNFSFKTGKFETASNLKAIKNGAEYIIF